ncbi:MAG TPA: glycoside hydrolase family 2 TIM barrel-domain containing protein [Puia sp.]|nr:glycoside hydrolase family 2 TIM barrel-domain containing protein [Puia sp.]
MKYILPAALSLLILSCFTPDCSAQDQTELNTGWKCINIGKVKTGGEKISNPSYSTKEWIPATVPGTVLTTLLDNKLVPDPFYGMNNEKIPDIYTTGRDYYTYWFIKDFKETVPEGNRQVWLHFRGINYSCEVYLNGHKLNNKTHQGMYLRQTYNITTFLSKEGANRLAVIVYPPDPVGNPNGGQGGDGEIARSITHQYVAGWDWIQPIRDRNTGIWDKVTIERTGPVNISNPHIITEVPGTRMPETATQQPAILKVSAELENTSAQPVSGLLKYDLQGETVSVPVTLQPQSRREVRLPAHLLFNPRLWWPNGYGPQNLYHTELVFEVGATPTSSAGAASAAASAGSPAPGDTKSPVSASTLSDKEPLDFGVREISTSWNSVTHSRQAWVNGQPVFIKGGNWIVSDELLRFSPERYDAEVRFHRDMNLNLIRVWGGALTERGEFYQACDKYGLLVFQDFWNSGDCNGRWLDPQKKEDQWTRRQYPDDHGLFLASVVDQVKMIRNHPSLAFWCGGNEITPTDDILLPMKDSILPSLDGTRYLFDYSNSDSMSFNSLGGNGDGPYGVQPIRTFWADRTFPFNSEVGSVGVGDYESLERFLPADHLTAPQYPGKEDPVWAYHKYIGYDSTVYAYGPVKDLKDFTLKAQLVNYDQYRALMEGFSSHMWEWYTGSIIWKTQNPWTALRGQMYDYYLDVNACLYGLHSGSEPLHVQFDPVENMVMIVNNTFNFHRNMMLEVKTYDKEGKEKLLTQVYEEIGPSTVRKYVGIGGQLNKLRKDEGGFLSLRLLNEKRQPISENFYWLPDATGQYSGLQHMATAGLKVEARKSGQGRIDVTLTNPTGNPVAFFNRVALIDPRTKKRLLPVFFSDNYVSVVPGASKTLTLEYRPSPDSPSPVVTVKGWNVEEMAVSPK